jgi:hypothetical protein
MKRNKRFRPAEAACPGCGDTFRRGTNTRQQLANFCSRACANRVRAVIHGYSGTQIYNVWTKMIGRCENPNDDAWDEYGGRGVRVCQRWRASFQDFLSDMGEPPESPVLSPRRRGLKRRIAWSIDRHPDRHGHYEPGNCRWATHDLQAQNRRSTKLTAEDVIAIRRLSDAGVPRRALAVKFGVSAYTIADIKSKRSWRNI